MHKAIIHIGTEKTGSTSIQNFLHRNAKALATGQIFYPKQTCGLISNYKLVLYALNAPDKGLCSIDKTSVLATLKPDMNDSENKAKFDEWKTQFVLDHDTEVQTLRKGLTSSTIVYSSEHFHSRTRAPEELARLKSLITHLYDDIKIVVYLRRQDRLAMSASNTAIQGGAVKMFSFDNIAGGSAYYDYASLMKRWTDAFGQENIQPQVFSKASMHHGDVVEDFAYHSLDLDAEEVIELTDTIKRKGNIITGALKSLKNSAGNGKQNTEKKQKKEQTKQSANTRLSFTALSSLVAFNKLDDDDPLLESHPKQSLRQKLIRELHHINDEYGELLPERASAEKFYEHFREANAALCEQWPNLNGFNEGFDMYPEKADDHPNIDTHAVLSKTLPLVFP